MGFSDPFQRMSITLLVSLIYVVLLPGPNSNKYKVRNLNSTWIDQTLLVSWENPQSNSKVKQYKVNYEMHTQDSIVMKAHYTVSITC